MKKVILVMILTAGFIHLFAIKASSLPNLKLIVEVADMLKEFVEFVRVDLGEKADNLLATLENIKTTALLGDPVKAYKKLKLEVIPELESLFKHYKDEYIELGEKLKLLNINIKETT